jgi:hypothetical protein
MAKGSTRRRLPTAQEMRLLKLIARSHVVKTKADGSFHTVWKTGEGEKLPDKQIQAIIRNGWLVPDRAGLGMFDDSVKYNVLKPR